MHRTGLFYDQSFLFHKTGKLHGVEHPESVQRYRRVMEALQALEGEKPDQLLACLGRRATRNDLLLCHSAEYIRSVEMDILHNRPFLRTGDTPIGGLPSLDVALQAVGTCLSAGDAVYHGAVDNAFCAVRPPGHHASRDRGMGFCVFNNAAILARYVQKKYQIERVAILDWDVHHGNGTQDIFYEDASVFFASIHSVALYPHTGRACEKGEGLGRGKTLNIPLESHTKGEQWLHVWQREVGEALRCFRPQWIILSAGFDGLLEDPVGDFDLRISDFQKLTELACQWAHLLCGERLIAVLEGGYAPEILAEGVKAHVAALAKEVDIF